MEEKNKISNLTYRKIVELSFIRDEVQYYEARDGEVIAYKGGYIHKLNFFEVDNKGNLIRSLYYDKSILRIFLNKKEKIVIERYKEKWKIKN